MYRLMLAFLSLLTITTAMAVQPMEETAFFDNTIAVYWSTNPSVYNIQQTGGIPRPSNDGSCTVDTTVIDQIYSEFTYGPSVITIRMEDPHESFKPEPWALAYCMQPLTNIVRSSYPDALVILDVTQLLWTDSMRDTLYSDFVDATGDWWSIATNSGSGIYFNASEIYMIVANDEAYNASNSDLNIALRDGLSQWSDWTTVDKTLGLSLTDHFTANPAYQKSVDGGGRSTYGFPWRYDVIAVGAYWVYNPNQPGHSLNEIPVNSGQPFDVRWNTFKSRLKPHQRVHVNVRSWWHDNNTGGNGWTIGGSGWNLGHLKWTVRAWCRWATGVFNNGQDRVTSLTFWSYQQHSNYVTPPNPPDGNYSGGNVPIVQASTLYDSGSVYYVPGLKNFHATVLEQGWGFSGCP